MALPTAPRAATSWADWARSSGYTEPWTMGKSAWAWPYFGSVSARRAMHRSSQRWVSSIEVRA